MSLIRRIQALAQADVPLDRAEYLLRATPKKAPIATVAERMREEKRIWAAERGLDESRAMGREDRIVRWMGWDIAPPPELEEEESDAT